MEVKLNANKSDQATRLIAEAIRPAFKIIGKEISKDYGGTMQHLWIDFELVQSHAEQRPFWPFRFQKRVGGSKCRLTGLQMPVHENVGHYGISPDFQRLLKMPLDAVASYTLSLIYESTAMLIEKQKKLGGFDAPRFRQEFLSSCKKHGLQIVHHNDASQ